LTATFIPRIYGFKIHKKKGSKFWEENKELNEISCYEERQLAQIKTINEKENSKMISK